MIRKTLIYKTGVEYGDYTLNHVLGCSHGCKYPCYAFMMARRFGKVKSYEDWIHPQVVENTMRFYQKSFRTLRIKSICFICVLQPTPLCMGTKTFVS